MDFVTRQDFFFSCDTDLCVSHDGALTWQRLSPGLSFRYTDGLPYVYQFDFMDPQTGLALVVDEEQDQRTLWKTFDGGESWELLKPVFSHNGH
jgi:photosystem II stability/assembly factor-like uncharacterized protein